MFRLKRCECHAQTKENTQTCERALTQSIVTSMTNVLQIARKNVDQIKSDQIVSEKSEM